MGDQLYLERFVWFDHEACSVRFPNANKLVTYFKIVPKTAQRFIDHFRDSLPAPLTLLIMDVPRFLLIKYISSLIT